MFGRIFFVVRQNFKMIAISRIESHSLDYSDIIFQNNCNILLQYIRSFHWIHLRQFKERLLFSWETEMITGRENLALKDYDLITSLASIPRDFIIIISRYFR